MLALLLGVVFYVRRQTAATNMNAESSRSHAVFTIFIKQTLEIPLPPSADSSSKVTDSSTGSTGSDQPSSDTDTEKKFKKTTIERRSKVCLIDLAGSERVNSTGATGNTPPLPRC